jgi:hypothetical protein
MLLYTLTKKFIEIQRKMLNAFDIILFYKMVWFDGQNIVLTWNQWGQGSIPLTIICDVEYVYLYICFIHMCKRIVSKWVVDNQVGGHDGWVGKYLLFIYLLHFYI